MVTIFNSLSGHQDKFIDKLFKKYSRMMFNVAFNILHKEADAEDAVHEAFIRIITYLPKIMKIDSDEIAFYLVIIVKNVAMDMIRERKHIARDDIDEIAICSDDSIENLVIENLSRNEIITELKKLSDSEYEILYLYIILGFKPNEIAHLLNLSGTSIRQRIYKAKCHLKKIWRDKDE